MLKKDLLEEIQRWKEKTMDEHEHVINLERELKNRNITVGKLRSYINSNLFIKIWSWIIKISKKLF